MSWDIADGEEEGEDDIAFKVTMFFSVVEASKKPGILNLAGRKDIIRSSDMILGLFKTHDLIAELILSRCDLDVRGTVRLLEGLVKTKNLILIDLSHNRIEDVQPLLPLLQENAVRHLLLDGNPCAKKDEDMAQLEALLEPKRYTEPLALRCLRTCLVSPVATPPPWLFRWLFTEKKEWWLRLLFHKDPATRRGAKAFILRFLKTLIPLERHLYVYCTDLVTPDTLKAIGSPHAPRISEQTAQCLQYIDFHLSMLEITRNYWKYFKEYFNIVAEFCLQGQQERLYLIKRGALFWLLDWYMGTYSPYRIGESRARVGSAEEPANLVSFFSALTALIRSMRTPGMVDCLSPTCFQDDVLEDMPSIDDPSIKSLLWIDEVIYSMLRQGYSNDAVCLMIEHISWHNEERTRWMAKMVFQRFIARTNIQDHMPNARFGLLRFLSIKDGLDDLRATLLLLLDPSDSTRDENRHPFFFIPNVVNRRGMEQLTSRISLLLDLLSEDLPAFHRVVRENATVFVSALKAQVIPSANDVELLPELLQQIDVLEIFSAGGDLSTIPLAAIATKDTATPPAANRDVPAAVAALSIVGVVEDQVDEPPQQSSPPAAEAVSVELADVSLPDAMPQTDAPSAATL